MKLDTMKLAVKQIGGRLQKHSPTILTGLAITGFVTTVVLAVKATPRAVDLLEEEIYDICNGEGALANDYLAYQEKEKAGGTIATIELLKPKDMIRVAWKCYIPAIGVGVTSVLCIVGANSIHLRRHAALAGVYSITEAALKEYQAKVVESIGPGKELKIRDAIAEDKIKNNPVNDTSVVMTGKGEVLCFDSLSGRYFKSDLEKIRRTVNELNRDLLRGDYLSLNEAYYALGLPSIKIGDQMGWEVNDGLIDPSYSTQMSEDGVPCIVVNFTARPKFL